MTENKFGKFETSGVGRTEGGSSSTVDYDALYKYVVKNAGLERMKSKTGTVVGIVDLGLQEQPDAEFEFKGVDREGDPITEEKYKAENSNAYFKDGFVKDGNKQRKARLVCFPQKPIQCVAIAVDFPDIILDQGQFFGKPDPKPLRMYIGGQFYNKTIGKMVVGRPTPLREKKYDNGKWGFAPNHILNKMASDCLPEPLIKDDEVFKPDDILSVIGKSYSFQVQVHFKESKGNKYFTKYIKYQGMLNEDIKITPLPENVELFYVGFSKENTEDSIKELPSFVVNTITNSVQFEGSQIEKDLEKYKNYKAQHSENKDEKESKGTNYAPVKGKVKDEAPDFEEFDNDIPF